MSISRIGISINDYQNTDKVEFARSILSPHSYRQTPEVKLTLIKTFNNIIKNNFFFKLSHFLTCVIVDNEIKDISLIGKAAHRLFQLRMMKPLITLLDYTRRLDDAKDIPNIAMFYARVFEWLFDKTSLFLFSFYINCLFVCFFFS